MTSNIPSTGSNIKIPRSFLKSPHFSEITRCLGVSKFEAMGRLMFYFEWKSKRKNRKDDVALIEKKFGQGFCTALQSGGFGSIKGTFFYLKLPRNILIKSKRSAGGLTRLSAQRNEKGQFFSACRKKRYTTLVADSEGNYLGTLKEIYAKNMHRRRSLQGT